MGNGFFSVPEVELILGRMCPLIGLIGFIFNLIVFLVLSHVNFKDTLYKFLRAESLLITIDMLVTIFKPIFYCNACQISKQYVAQFYQVYFNIYLASVLEMSAIMCRNFSAFICLLLISNKLPRLKEQFLKPNTFLITLVFIVLFSVAFYLYQIFENYIASDVDSFNCTVYSVQRTEFGNSQVKGRMEIAATVLRDGVNLFVLVTLNVLILISLKKSLKKKKHILTATVIVDDSRTKIGAKKNENEIHHDSAPVNCNLNQITNINRKEVRQTIMIILTCLNYLIGRLPILYIFVKRNLFEDTSNFGVYAIMIAYISYAANIVFYFNSNSRFRFVFKIYVRSAVDSFKNFIFCNS